MRPALGGSFWEVLVWVDLRLGRVGLRDHCYCSSHGPYTCMGIKTAYVRRTPLAVIVA